MIDVTKRQAVQELADQLQMKLRKQDRINALDPVPVLRLGLTDEPLHQKAGI